MIGDFAWRVDKAAQLFEHNRMQLKAQYIQKQPSLAQLTDSELCQTLAKRIDMSAQDIEKALFLSWRDEAGFVECSHLFHQLRQALSA